MPFATNKPDGPSVAAWVPLDANPIVFELGTYNPVVRLLKMFKDGLVTDPT